MDQGACVYGSGHASPVKIGRKIKSFGRRVCFRSEHVKQPEAVHAMKPDMVYSQGRRDPCRADNQRVASPAVPPVQGVSRDEPGYAERVGPVGEEMHQATACEAETDGGPWADAKKMIRKGEHCNPADTPMRERAMRDP